MIEGKGKKIRLGGHDFIEIDKADLPFDKGTQRGTTVLLPFNPPDDKKEFPSDASVEDGGFVIGAGIATHKVSWWDDEAFVEEKLTAAVTNPGLLAEYRREGLRAKQLEVFDEFRWYGECYGVLNAHGWLDRSGRLAPHIIEHVVDHYGQREVDDAKAQYGDNWTIYIAELAATRLARPLSRLWYAVNMKALYYIHHDDMRLGYLWAEYRMRLRHEQDSFRGKKSVSSGSDGGNLRAKNFERRNHEILARMKAHVDAGMSVSNAANLVNKAGYGTSAEANRKLWTRRHKK